MKKCKISVIIGADYVRRQFDSVKNPSAAVLPDKYAQTCLELIELTLRSSKASSC